MFWARQARPLLIVHSDLSLFWKSDRVSAHESPFSDPTLWRFSHLSCSLFCPSFWASGKLARCGCSRSRNLQPRCGRSRSRNLKRKYDRSSVGDPNLSPLPPQSRTTQHLSPLPNNPRMYMMTQDLLAPVLLATLLLTPREQRSTKTRPQSRLGDSSGLHPRHQHQGTRTQVAERVPGTTTSQRWAASGCSLAIGDREPRWAAMLERRPAASPKIGKS